jgi:hypothetical protein
MGEGATSVREKLPGAAKWRRRLGELVHVDVKKLVWALTEERRPGFLCRTRERPA